MGPPGFQTWTLLVLFSWMHVARGAGGPFFWSIIPGVLESEALTKVCTSVIMPNGNLKATVTLTSKEHNMTILTQMIRNSNMHICSQFKVPAVADEEVRSLEVEVQGDNFYSKESRKVMIRAYKPRSFVQTDKPIYLPGQTVHFRVVTLDSKFRAVEQLYNLIELEDANGNRIGQWLNQTCERKILQLSYDLNSECAEGTYKIILDVNGDKTVHVFKVEKYVLPKFEVTIETESEVNIMQDSFEAKVCAKYTFGQPVPGKAKLSVCRSLAHYLPALPRPLSESTDVFQELTAPCHEETKQTDAAGCATFTMEMSTFTKLDNKVLQDTLVFSAEVEEEGTEITLSQKKTAGISYVIGRLLFVDTPTIYEKGENVMGKVKAVYFNDTPIANKDLYLFKGQRWNLELFLNVTTNSDGTAHFRLCPTDDDGTIYLQVSVSPTMEYPRYRTPQYESGEHTLTLAQEASSESKTSSTFELKAKDEPLRCCGKEELIVKYSIVGESPGPVDLMYIVMSRGVIIMQGSKEISIEDKTVTEGETSVIVDVSENTAPYLVLVVYALLPSETMIVQSNEYAVEKCFNHQVSLQFAPPSAVPGEDVTMQVTAHPDSLCGVSIIDKSVLLQEPGKILDASKIYDLLPVTKVNYLPYQIEDPHPCLPVRPKRYLRPPFPDNNDDPYTIFQNVGLKIATNLFVRMPSCLLFKGRTYHSGQMHIAMRYNSPPMQPMVERDFGGAVGAAAPPSIIETVRTFFPETWIWELVEVGPSGVMDMTITAPDTITTWETEAFCISEQGFGLAPRQELTVFQPFFLELTLPYSIVRGERFELKATVFNYLSSCIMVKVMGLPSDDYTLNNIGDNNNYQSCLCASERKTFSWMMLTSKIGVVDVSVTAEAITSDISCNNEVVSVPERGRIDLVKKSLIVKAEGVEVTKNYNWLLCQQGVGLPQVFTYQLPDNAIPGSQHGSVSVLGDIMGRALRNVDNLLKMPYGCGEQNMALLAPNIYILEYLKNTDQLTEAIKEKGLKFLTSGYQRQLNYKHDSGAYSAFGTGRGNTWLTAFVLRSFVKAQSFIFIDVNVIQEAKLWLETLQDKDGCFQMVGRLFHNRMKGGVEDKVTVTAYITAAFLEMGLSTDNPVVQKSLSCLKESLANNEVQTLSNTYVVSLMAYVFTLSGDTQERTTLLNHLDSVAVKQGGTLHWNQQSAETSASLSVETSSYVMLAHLSGSPTASDLGTATRIVRWLTTQQNHYGGYSSTQDTVVALQALALYATKVFVRGGSTRVVVNSPEGILEFHVDQTNKLLYQEKQLTNVEGQYRIETHGTACVLLQLSVQYNIPTPNKVNKFLLEVASKVSGRGSPRPKLTLNITVMYTGEEESSNMVIVEINMLSGFFLDPQSLKTLKDLPLVDRVDEHKGYVQLYIETLQSQKPMVFSLVIIQEHEVLNLKPAVVTIYDYYQPDLKREKEYSFDLILPATPNLGQDLEGPGGLRSPDSQAKIG